MNIGNKLILRFKKHDVKFCVYENRLDDLYNSIAEKNLYIRFLENRLRKINDEIKIYNLPFSPIGKDELISNIDFLSDKETYMYDYHNLDNL